MPANSIGPTTPLDLWSELDVRGSTPLASAGRVAPVKRQKKSGTPKRKAPRSWDRPLTKDSFAKTVEIMPDGTRNVSLSPHVAEILEHQREMFREKFGRDPGPGDPIFFDPDADTPQPLPPLDPNAVEAVAVEAGVRPEIAYAIAKTGVFLMKENAHLYSEKDKEQFQAAIDEYRERAKRQDA